MNKLPIVFSAVVVGLLGCSSARYSAELINRQTSISEIGVLQPICDLKVIGVGEQGIDTTGSAENAVKLISIIKEELGQSIVIDSIELKDADSLKNDIYNLITQLRGRNDLTKAKLGAALKTIMNTNKDRFYMVVYQNAYYGTAGHRALAGATNILLAPVFLKGVKAESRIYFFLIDKQREEVIYYDKDYADRSGKFYKGDNLDPTDRDELKIQVEKVLKKFKELQS